MSTSVGSIGISLDLEVSSNLQKQISNATKGISESLRKGIEKSMSGANVSNSLEKSLSKAKNSAVNSGNKIGDNIAKGIEKSSSKVERSLSSTLEKAANVTSQKKFNLGDATKQDLMNERDSKKSMLENIRKKTDLKSDDLGFMLELDPSGSSEKFLKLEAEFLKLVEQSERLESTIGKLDNAINNFDADKASAESIKLAKEQSALSKEMEKVTASANRQAIANQKIESGKVKASIESEKLTQSQIKTQQMMEKVNATAQKTTSSISKMGNTAGKAKKPLVNMGSVGRSLTRSLLGVGLILGIVSSAVRSMAKNLWSSMKTNEQFQKSLSQVKSNLATAFQPIFEAIMPALNALMSGLAKVTAYIAAFVSLLFGKSVKASNANAKALAGATAGMKGYGSAAEEAQRKVAGFDQLNDMTEEKNSGGGGGAGGSGIGDVNIDESIVSKMEAMMNKIKEMIKKAFDSEPVKAFVNMSKAILEEFGKSSIRIFGAIYSNALETFKQMSPHLSRALSNISKMWTNIFNDIADMVRKWVPLITDQIVYLIDNISNTFRPFFVLLSKMWADFTEILLNVWNEYGASILDGIGECIAGMVETFNLIWTEIIDPIITPALEMMSKLWDEHIKDIVAGVAEMFAQLILLAIELNNKMIKPIIDWLVKYLSPAFKIVFGAIFDVVGKTLGNILSVVKHSINSITGVLQGLINFISGVFSGNWSQAWSGVVQIFSSIFSGIANIVKSPMNYIISSINRFLSSLNRIRVPDWVPGVGGFGFSMPSIPYLANGGVLKQPTLNLAGEYPGASSNPEIVTPQNIMADTFRSVMQEFVGALSSDQKPNEQDIKLMIDIGGVKFLEKVIKLTKEYETMTGKAAFM